jgi:hypothetical protein
LRVTRRNLVKGLAAVPLFSVTKLPLGLPPVSQPFTYIVGIVGSPSTPDVAWSDDELKAIQEIGFNTLQMSIAWAWKPAKEVLNLEDLDDPKNLREWHRRVTRAKKFGFRTLAHFGVPKTPLADATAACILDPPVRENYANRLRRLFREFPEIDDVMIYTYDQLAWLCSEFGSCPRCRGIPLSKRLPGFLEEMVDAVQASKPGARLWWEPWELSAGQTYAIAESIRPEHFGLIVHNSIAEVQFVNTTDHWLQNVARIAQRRGIPVIGEAFLSDSGEDIAPLTHLACPRLVYQEARALRNTRGVVGIKEYFGLAPKDFSVNVRLLKGFLAAPATPFDDLIASVAAEYGKLSRDALLEAWEATAEAMELFPWDASWHMRGVFGSPLNQPWKSIPLASWITPSWQANRRAFYMVSDERRAVSPLWEDAELASPWKERAKAYSHQHPWLLEDVALRALASANAFDRASASLKKALASESARRADLEKQLQSVSQATRVSRHVSEELLAALQA